ncbi:cytosolic beta-glucosidase-like [Glandiceps talaboti]
MELKYIVSVLTLVIFAISAAADDPVYVYPGIFDDPERDAFLYGIFPQDFIWSTATSSYQIEGGWDADGKGVNIWDTFSHEEGNVDNGDTGDVACDSYNKWQEDVKIMEDLKLKYYRFSISWARILPNGTTDYINEAGIQYYNALIDDLLAAGITPFITLYHWDLPQALNDSYGGWLGEEIVDDFGNYSRLCYERFGDRVKFWITLNEPWVIAINGYEGGDMAPGIQGEGQAVYIVAHNLIKSHARAWHIYDDEFRDEQNGVIGISFNSDFYEPNDRDVNSDLESAERMQQFFLGWFAHPIYIGDYPDIMKTRIEDLSEQQGFNESRLPEFTSEEIDYIKGTSDFFGLNHYTSRMCEDNTDDDVPLLPPSWNKDHGVHTFAEDHWPRAESSWLYVVPWGLRRLLAWIKEEYGNPPIYITENGFSTADILQLNDTERVDYYRSYINEVLKAIQLDEVDVKAYTAWSLMDNFEWARGYTERFGIHYVDFDDDERPRTQKESAKLYAQIIEDNGFPSEVSGTSSMQRLLWLFVIPCVVFKFIMREKKMEPVTDSVSL